MPASPTKQKTNQIPKLRFSGFDGGWEEKKLGEMNIFISDGNYGEMYPKASEMKDSGVPFIRANNIKDLKVVWGDMKYISPDLHTVLQSGHLESEDILVTTRGDIGMLAYVTGEFHGSNINAQICLLRTNKDLSSRFLLFYLSSSIGRKQFKELQTGSALKQLPKGNLAKIKINIPSLPEQQKIAGFLGAVDGWIENLRGQKESLESYKKGMMQKIFDPSCHSRERGNPGTSCVRFRDDNGKNFPDWEEKKLGEVATFLKGAGISKDDVVDGGKNKCIRYGELYTYYDEIITKVKSSTNVSASDSLLSKKNDVLIPSSGETALDIATVSCLNEDGILLGGDLNVMRLQKNQSGEFFAYYLSNVKNEDIAELAQGNSVVHLYASHLKTLRINIPSLPEQKKIADFLTSLDKIIESKKHQITRALQWKKGLMQGLFV